MLLFAGKIILLFSTYIFGIRVLGKTALAQLTPHDFGAIFFLAYLLFGSIEVDGILQGAVGVLIVITLHLLVSKLALLNKLNKYLIGEPTFLIKKGEIMTKNLEKSHYTMAELLSSIRTAGYFDITEVDYAVLEPNGAISVLPKKEMVTVTPHHLNLEVEDKGLPVAVIVEGKIQHSNLKSIKKDEQWLKSELAQKGYRQFKNILLATVSEKEKHIHVYNHNT